MRSGDVDDGLVAQPNRTWSSAPKVRRKPGHALAALDLEAGELVWIVLCRIACSVVALE